MSSQKPLFMENFKINPVGNVSEAFLANGISQFSDAAQWVMNLRYARNEGNKSEPLILFNEKCGTCSTKHALLKRLIDEHHVAGFSLMVGIFNMGAQNTPKIKNVLEKYNLAYIPEAHCYLLNEAVAYDFTSKAIKKANITDEIISATPILPEQCDIYKKEIHQVYLKNWLLTHPEIKYSLEEIWRIRESCIKALSV